VLLDRYGKISENYFARVTPTLVAINPDGNVELYKSGYKETDNEIIRNIFKKLSGK